MKRLFAWVAGAAGGLAAYRAMRRRRPGAETGADARAAELRAKLEEARAVADDRDAFESGELAVDESEPRDLQARRTEVHEQGRAALDEMRGEQAS